MGKVISKDLRERVVALVDAGHSCRAAAKHFRVSNSFAIKLLQRRKHTGTVESKRRGRPPGSGKLAPFRAFLMRQVEDKPDITLPELAARLKAAHGLEIRPSSLSRILLAHGFTYKKSADGGGTRTRQGAAGAGDLDRQASAKDAP